MTAHYISKHWTMEKLLVHCGPAPGKHTAVLIAEKLDQVIASLALAPEMFTAMTTDNAANMLNAVSKESKNIMQGLGCLDHWLLSQNVWLWSHSTSLLQRQLLN